MAYTNVPSDDSQVWFLKGATTLDGGGFSGINNPTSQSLVPNLQTPAMRGQDVFVSSGNNGGVRFKNPA
jgi:hypothetical protein